MNNFNYIVPIFNKEDILEDTLNSIERCATSNSKIIMIVDGCTDKSEDIVDEFCKNSSHQTVKILMPNVHMLLSVNAGLSHVKSGFTVITQDDIILGDFDLEKKIVELYNRHNNNLGVISFRYGSNIEITNIFNRIRNNTISGMINETDFIKGKDDYANYLSGEYENFYPRMSAINGPNIIPWQLLSQNGVFDKNLAPFGFDDPEYCLRSLKLGYINGLFPLKYTSEIEWGGTRRSKSFIKKAAEIHKRNRIYIYNKHKDFLKSYLKHKKIYKDDETI
jgi:glycosyltransferase involved in cell wall biosynthesis